MNAENELVNKKSRGENWIQEEKDLFLEIMRTSSSIIENKQTDTNTNKKKNKEWMKIQSKLRELTGRSRDIAQLKGFWRRTKLTAKKNVSEHKRAVRSTGGGLRPPSPSQEDLIIMQICPTDFVNESNKFDSDGISQNAAPIVVEINNEAQQNNTIYDIELNETVHNNELEFVNEIITVADVHNPEVQIKTQLDEDNLDKQKMKVKTNKIKEYSDDDKTKHCKNKISHKEMIFASNTNYKKRSLEMLEEEHKIKMKFHKQQLIHQELRHKIEIDILLLEKEKKELEIKLLKS